MYIYSWEQTKALCVKLFPCMLQRHEGESR